MLQKGRRITLLPFRRFKGKPQLDQLYSVANVKDFGRATRMLYLDVVPKSNGEDERQYVYVNIHDVPDGCFREGDMVTVRDILYVHFRKTYCTVGITIQEVSVSKEQEPNMNEGLYEDIDF